MAMAVQKKKGSVWFPAKLQPLFKPARYKILRGGRGGSKSWGIARALLLIANKQKKRILCAREFQNSISDSVHRLLEEQIFAMGLADRFVITENSIYCPATGSEFIFKGLRRDITKIKSTEGIDIVWIEEAEKVSNKSWEVLIPTVRKEGSEIWISFNPDDEKDPTWVRFVANVPPDAIEIEISWMDNPWLPETLRKEKDYLYRVDPEAAAHVWGGELNKRSDAQIFKGKFIIEDFVPEETWHGPYFGQDFGFSTDPAATTKSWINPVEQKLYIEHEAFGLGLMSDELAAYIATIPGATKHVIRADCSRPETIAEMVKRGLMMESCKKWEGCVEDGIQYLRSFVQIVIHPRCRRMAEEARLYKYKIDKLSGDILPIIVDKHNHGWDSIRYALEPMIREVHEEIVVVDAAGDIQISSDLDEADAGIEFGSISNW
jgi:phage terminase large subunit